jgi:hypothetical protein
MTFEPFGDDLNPVTFTILAAIADVLCGMLVPAEVAIGLELKRVLHEASNARLAGTRVAPETVEAPGIEAGVILMGALEAVLAQWAEIMTEPRVLPGRADPPRRMDA